MVRNCDELSEVSAEGVLAGYGANVANEKLPFASPMAYGLGVVLTRHLLTVSGPKVNFCVRWFFGQENVVSYPNAELA